MDQAVQQATQQSVEHDVRMLIGDLHLQIIMLRAELAAVRQRVEGIAEPPAKANGARQPEVRT
jgi:hypothetical protein